ncbi:MAG: betaine/proline/choline family ABC transporter ATP-binding protein [Synergistales bacterium]|nr:betaine/proline/choline family ABC transporter ATP-binding protein [Synergistales bacterium]
MVLFEHVSKVYPNETRAVDDLNLRIEEGELVTFIGPSGCGKTSTLKMVNRLEDCTEGTIYVNGRDIYSIDAVQLRRDLGYVIQEIALMPHMSVAENIAIVPRLLKWPQKKITKRVDELLEMANLPPREYRHRLPGMLSGGQKQRIGVLRAMAADPPVILMDEPFGALDPLSRGSLQDEFLLMQEQMKKTIVFVTHDMDEAIKMADKIVLMRNGKVEQMGTPEELQEEPATEFVKNFIGEDRLSQISPESPVDTLVAPPTIQVRPSRGAKDVLDMMEDEDVEFAQVVDKRGKWVGMAHASLLKRAARRDGTARDGVRQNRVLCSADANMRDAAEMLADRDMPIPVVDEDGMFLGIITSGEVAKLAIGRLSRTAVASEKE